MKFAVVRQAEAEARRAEESWGSVRWLANGESTDTGGLTVGRVVIRPGMSNPRHSHPNCDEVLHLLRGTLEHSVGDETVVLHAGDTLVVPAGVAHHAVNVGSQDADMIVAYDTGERQFRPEVR